MNHSLVKTLSDSIVHAADSGVVCRFAGKASHPPAVCCSLTLTTLRSTHPVDDRGRQQRDVCSGSLFQTVGGPDHTRINSIATFAPAGQSVRARARIRPADLSEFGFQCDTRSSSLGPPLAITSILSTIVSGTMSIPARSSSLQFRLWVIHRAPEHSGAGDLV